MGDDLKKFGLGLLMGILIEKEAPGEIEAIKKALLKPIKVMDECLKKL